MEAAASCFLCIWLMLCAVAKKCLNIERLGQRSCLADGRNTSHAAEHDALARANQVRIINIINIINTISIQMGVNIRPTHSQNCGEVRCIHCIASTAQYP